MKHSEETIEFAYNMIGEYRRCGARWSELASPADLCDTVAFYVSDVVQETNLLDIEDVLIEILVRVKMHGCIRSLREMIVEAVRRFSATRCDSSPSFTLLLGSSNDDDQQGSEKIDHDMSSVVCPEAGPGSDLHIAFLDVRENLGEDYGDNFECQLAGASRRDIERDRGISYERLRWMETKTAEFLERGEYTLDTTNRRLGSAKEFESGRVFFKASKDVKVDRNLPEVDHRSTSYVDIEEHDNTPLRPIGEIVIESEVIFSDADGILVTKVDDRNTTPGVVTDRCKKLPGFTMNGHTIKDCSRKSVSAVGNTNYDYFKYCDELYDSTVRTREHLL